MIKNSEVEKILRLILGSCNRVREISITPRLEEGIKLSVYITKIEDRSYNSSYIKKFQSFLEEVFNKNNLLNSAFFVNLVEWNDTLVVKKTFDLKEVEKLYLEDTLKPTSYDVSFLDDY